MPVQPGYDPQTLEEASTESILDAVEGYVRGGLDDFAFASTDLPNFLADDSPIVAAGQPTRQILRAACRSYARGSGPQSLPGFDAVWGGICEPYLESIGENPSPGSLGPAGTGGQCPGVLYNVRARLTNPGNPPQTTEANLVGPLRFNQDLPAYPSNPGCTGGSSWNRFSIAGSTATAIISQSGCDAGLEVLAITPLDGSADNCGDPPPLYDPPKVKPGLPTIGPQPIQIPGIGPVNVDVSFDPDGTLIVNLPDIGVEVPISDPFGFGDGDGDGGPGGGGPTPPAPGDDGQPGSGQAAGPGQDAQGEAPPGSVLVGLKMNMTTIPPRANQYMPGAYRGAAYIYMGGNAGLDQDFAGSVLANGQFVYAEKDNLTKWKVRANNDFVFNVVPYYREVE